MDMTNDQDVCNTLVIEVVKYAKSHGLCTPSWDLQNFTTNETAGVLVEGFDPPKIMMTYNKPYYKTLLENFGLKKEMDLCIHDLHLRFQKSQYNWLMP